MSLLKAVPLPVLLVLCLTLGLAPFTPEPHVVAKGRMLVSGNLSQPLDRFDLLIHALPFALLTLRLILRIGKNGA